MDDNKLKMGNTQVKEEDLKETPLLMDSVKGASPDQKMEKEFPIHRAAYLGDVKKLEVLLDSDDSNSNFVTRKLDDVGCTPLHYAAMGGELN